jgi:5-methylcytosine-specific restriction protein A
MIDWLLAQGHATSRLRIQIAGELGTLITDTWMPESRTLIEAKGDATRNDIRMAVAQLLDYRRHITPAPLRSTVVVPIAPTRDLHDFGRSAVLSLAVFDSRGLTYLVE